MDLSGGGPLRSALVIGGTRFIGSHLVTASRPRVGGSRWRTTSISPTIPELNTRTSRSPRLGEPYPGRDGHKGS